MTSEANHRVWGHLGDLSLGGFYVSTFGPLAVGTEVRFTLEVGGQRFSGVGVVKTSHPGVGMAVVYAELSPEHEAVLQGIVQQLEANPGTSACAGLQIE